MHIFSTALQVKEMQELTQPKNDQFLKEGDLLKWQDIQLSLHGKVSMKTMNRAQLFNTKRIFVYLNIVCLTLDECMQHCDEKVGGRVPSIVTREEFDEVVDFLSVRNHTKKQHVWLSVIHSDQSKTWSDIYTGDAVKHLKVYGRRNVAYLHNKNKIALAKSERSEYDQDRIFCLCSLQTVKLKGLPQCLDISRLFLPRKHSTQNNTVMFKGFEKDEINLNLRYRDENGRNSSFSTWINLTSSLLVRSQNSDPSKIFGKRNWTVSKGSLPCGEHHDVTLELMLTKCLHGNFTCNDSQCIAIEKRCDNVVNCRDESDEVGCKSLALKQSYNKFAAPITDVSVNISLEDIVSIREFDDEINLKISVTLKWIETRVTYQNLKGDQVTNTLLKGDIEQLWIPKLTFQNSKDKHDTTSDLSKVKLFISKEGNTTWSSNGVAEDIATFRGNENPIVMTYTTSLNFDCDFNFMFFPFDTQVKSKMQ